MATITKPNQRTAVHIRRRLQRLWGSLTGRQSGDLQANYIYGRLNSSSLPKVRRRQNAICSETAVNTGKSPTWSYSCGIELNLAQ